MFICKRQEHKAITKIYLRKISLVWTYESREKSLILTGTRNFSLLCGPHSLLFALYRGRDKSGWSVMLTTGYLLAPNSRLSGAIPLLLLNFFMTSTGGILILPFRYFSELILSVLFLFFFSKIF